ncbi:MAG: type IV pilus secretin PilQ [Acidobacteriota bacterium]
MTVHRGLALLLTVAAAGALVSAAAPPGTLSTVRLKAISARVNARGASLVIEASEPVAYTASRPDPLTLLLDFRNVAASDVANSVAADVKSPVARVSVEASESLGAPASRVRVALTQPVAHHIRSERNTVVIDFDRPSVKAVPFVLPPASRATPDSAPDAMLALQAAPAQDPIATLGLDVPAGGPSAVSAPVSSAGPSTRFAAMPVQAAPPPVPTQTPTEQVGNGRGRQFTGHPISLDFQGADLRAVLRTFAEISGLNIVIDPTIQGTVDVALRDVPWDQALDIILRANKLGYAVDGTIVRIAPLAVLADEEVQRRKLADEQALAGELHVMTRALSYARAEDLRPLLTATVLSQRGSIQTDVRTNTLIINDLSERLERATSLIAILDSPQPQVEIEARIVQTSRTFARTLGVQWGFNGRASAALGNTLPLPFPNSGSVTGRTGITQGAPGDPASTTNTAVNLAAGAASSAIGLALGSINGALNLDVALSALEQQGNGRILSTPRVSTQNNVEAEITQGVQIPIQTVANNTVTVTFKDAALTLKVTPQITAADTVIMRISVENASPDFSRSVNNIPPIDTQRAVTQVLVSNGETTVIGGIYVSREQSTQDRTPALYRLPLLGWLFKRDLVTDENRELLIFITPRIIRL